MFMEPIELVLGHPAAGGGFVARDDGGRVVFVRHGLPGERVRAVITEEHPRWARADAIEILEASPDRVSAPCSRAGVGRCGGCDYQHASLEAQRGFKAQLIAEQLRRVAKIDRTVEVEAAPENNGGLGNRTRVRFGVSPRGHIGMRQHRSNEIVEMPTCPLAVERIAAMYLEAETYPAGYDIEACAIEGSAEASLLRDTAETHTTEATLNDGFDHVVVDTTLGRVQETTVAGMTFQVSPGSFWQIHRRAPEILVAAVLKGLDLHPGDCVLDLYAGVGLFTKAAAEVVGVDGLVVAIEDSEVATEDAIRNTSALAWVDVITGNVDGESVRENGIGSTHGIIDPPRSGIDRSALEALNAISTLKTIVSVSCDPATFARDLKLLMDAGWQLGEVRAFDLFEHTEHVEILGTLTRP